MKPGFFCFPGIVDRLGLLMLNPVWLNICVETRDGEESPECLSLLKFVGDAWPWPLIEFVSVSWPFIDFGEFIDITDLWAANILRLGGLYGNWALLVLGMTAFFILLLLRREKADMC